MDEIPTVKSVRVSDMVSTMVDSAVNRLASGKVVWDVGFSILPSPDEGSFASGMILSLAIPSEDEQQFFERMVILRPYGLTQEDVDLNVAELVEHLEQAQSEEAAKASTLDPEASDDQQQ